MPLRVCAEVEPGVDWHAALTEAVTRAFREESSILQILDVDFDHHKGSLRDNCAGRTQLRAHGSAASFGVVRVDRSVVDLLAEYRSTNAGQRGIGSDMSSAGPPSIDPRDTTWVGPVGEISWAFPI